MTLNLSPKIAATLNAQAQQNGVVIETLIERMVEEKYPATEEEAAPELSEQSKALIALMDKWIAEAPTDPEEIRKAEADRDEFIANLNKNRIESGERPLFP